MLNLKNVSMKKPYDFRALLILGAAALSLTSCGNDEKTFSLPPSLPGLGISSPVTAIRTNTSIHGGKEAVFQYDNEGHMTGGTDFWGDFEISFQPLSFTVSSSDATDTWKNIRTNAVGNIVSATIEEHDDYDETYIYPLSASYSADGRLTNLVVTESYDGITATYSWALEYEGGKLIRMVEEDTEPGYRYTTTYEYEYDTTGKRPNSGISFFTEEDIVIIEQFQWYGGYWGLLSNEIPLRCKATYREEEDGEETYSSSKTTNYSVTFDSEDRVSTLTFSNTGERLTFTYANESDNSAYSAASDVRPASADVQPATGKSLHERIRANRAVWRR